MRHSAIVTVLICWSFACSSDAQDQPPPIEQDRGFHGNIHFEFTHSLRIPDYHVTVDFFDRPWLRADTIEVRAISKPMIGHGWQETARDTTFFISKAEYERLLIAVNAITVPKIEALDGLSIGTDGYTCVIEYGDIQNSVAIKVWMPSEKKEPSGFFAACKLILEVGGFDPKKIFGR